MFCGQLLLCTYSHFFRRARDSCGQRQDDISMPGTEFEGLWHNSEIVGPGCHRLGLLSKQSDTGCLHSKVVSKVRICCWGARFPNGTMITGVFENHGATGEAFAPAMPFLMPKRFFQMLMLPWMLCLRCLTGHQEVGKWLHVHRLAVSSCSI